MIEVDGKAVLYHGDCLEVLKTLPDCSVDSIVCDPPAGIAFMGKEWDKDKGGRDAWIAWMQLIARECLRVIKHGGHALVWALPRTSHWTGMAWENAGWEPRDKIVHLFGTGFPKSLNVSASIEGLLTRGSANKTAFKHLSGDKVQRGNWGIAKMQQSHGQREKDYDTEAESDARLSKLSPTTDEAKEWEGWGTALKPAAEDWWLLRKPLDGTVAGNVLKHGTGALNIDGCRVATDDVASPDRLQRQQSNRQTWEGGEASGFKADHVQPLYSTKGRWPANVITDGSDEVVAGFPNVNHKTGGAFKNTGELYGQKNSPTGYNDNGSAARFFYCAKASVSDREEGLDDLPYGTLAYSNGAQAAESDGADEYTGGSTDIGLNNIKKRKNTHPTVKHTELMRYLCRLVTPPHGVVLDPFMGSGSTGKACVLEKFRFIGIEMEAQYLKIAEARIAYAATGKTLRANPEPEEVAKEEPSEKAQSSVSESPVQTSLFD